MHALTTRHDGPQIGAKVFGKVETFSTILVWLG